MVNETQEELKRRGDAADALYATMPFQSAIQEVQACHLLRPINTDLSPPTISSE